MKDAQYAPITCVWHSLQQVKRLQKRCVPSNPGLCPYTATSKPGPVAHLAAVREAEVSEL
eukprot:6209829-Pleurochrysis_carterae.AAC.3